MLHFGRVQTRQVTLLIDAQKRVTNLKIVALGRHHKFSRFLFDFKYFCEDRLFFLSVDIDSVEINICSLFFFVRRLTLFIDCMHTALQSMSIDIHT